MEMQELVDRIERWKRRQAGIEEAEPARPMAKAAPGVTNPQAFASDPAEGEVTDEFEVEPVTGVEAAQPSPEPNSSMAYPPENSLESLPDDPDDDISGISLSEFEEVK